MHSLLQARELVMSGALRENDDAAAVEDPHIVACNWDCETVLSNYSNIDNHPGLLSEPSSRCVPSSPVYVCRPKPTFMMEA